MNVTDQNGITSYAIPMVTWKLLSLFMIRWRLYKEADAVSPAGRSANPSATGPVSYGFQSNYYKGATNPKGETQFDFRAGDFEFNALNFDYLVVNGAKAQFKGLGKMTNGLVEQSGIAFIMTVIDGDAPTGGGVDKIRMKIYNKNSGQVI